MLNENIKISRKSKGLSQDELAIKLNVVRQTVSKWERGLSVPDSEMLISLSEILEIPVSTLLGENIEESKANDLEVISQKLEVINLQLAQKKDYNIPELAVAGVLVHGFEWIFIRVFPFALIALIAGIIITRKKSL